MLGPTWLSSVSIAGLWALSAGAGSAFAAVASVLIVCYLLCVLCCRRRHHRRRPRDKEAVGLGSARSSTTAHLVQPEVGDVESGPEGPQQWGRLQLSLQYDSGSQQITVGLKQAVDLRARGPGGTADPYACVSLPTQAGHRHETKVHRGTLSPVFDETFCFHAELTGELCCSLRYVPGPGRLTVVVLEARGLSPGLAEPYVKVQLVLNQRKWKKRKTSARKGTAAPSFNEAFTFLLPFSQIQSVDLVLAVWARGPRLRAEPVGKVALGARASGQPLQHWADMLAHARRPVTQWHRLRPPREVEQALALQPRLRLPLPGS